MYFLVTTIFAPYPLVVIVLTGPWLAIPASEEGAQCFIQLRFSLAMSNTLGVSTFQIFRAVSQLVMI